MERVAAEPGGPVLHRVATVVSEVAADLVALTLIIEILDSETRTDVVPDKMVISEPMARAEMLAPTQAAAEEDLVKLTTVIKAPAGKVAQV
jgi:hypothetical protein